VVFRYEINLEWNKALKALGTLRGSVADILTPFG